MHSSPFLNLSSRITHLESYLKFSLIIYLSSFTFDKDQTKYIPLEMTIQESVYCTIFSVHSLLHYYIVSVAYTKFLYMDMTIAIKVFNEMQQTAYPMILQLFTLLTFNCITITVVLS